MRPVLLSIFLMISSECADGDFLRILFFVLVLVPRTECRMESSCEAERRLGFWDKHNAAGNTIVTMCTAVYYKRCEERKTKQAALHPSSYIKAAPFCLGAMRRITSLVP